jgi:flagellar protein FlaG
MNNIGAATAKTMQPETAIPVLSPIKVVSQVAEDNLRVAKAKEVQKSNLSTNETKALASELNEIMDDLHTNLGFSIRDDLNNTVIVEIKNQDTNELIKQIPSEELLTIREKMLELTGLLLDQSV